MSLFPASFEEMIDRFASLPGIGSKSARRLAFHVMSLPEGEAEAFAQAILTARRTIHRCPVCQSFTDRELCSICEDESRDRSVICVVAQMQDIESIEKSREYHGVYHVLNGVLSPVNHIGPEDLSIQQLLQRVAGGGVKEVIIALNPDTEGDTTALYLSRLLKPLGVKATQIAHGIPVGSRLEFADIATVISSMDGRREI